MKTTAYGEIKNLACYLANRTDDTASSGKLTTSEATALRAFFAGDLPELWTREAWSELCGVHAVTLNERQFTKPLVNIMTVSGGGYSAVNQAYEENGSLGDKPLYGDQPDDFGDSIEWNSSAWAIVVTISGVRNIVYSSTEDVDTPDLVTSWVPNPIFADPSELLPAPTVVKTQEAANMGDIIGIYSVDPRIHQGESLEWTELDDVVRVFMPLATVYVDYQQDTPDLLDESILEEGDDYELPARFKFPMACRGAAFLLNDEDPMAANRLRAMAESELLRQAGRIKRPWWRVGKAENCK